MGNLCAIFHQRFKELVSLVPNARQAQLLDYILLGWQTSTYRLKHSDKVWFMKSYDEIFQDTGIPRSTLNTYIRSLVNLGFLERRHALYSGTLETGFIVRKATYLTVTDKLLSLLKTNDANHNPAETLTCDQSSTDASSNIPSTCSDFNKNERTLYK